MARKLQTILGFSLVLIFASSIAPADSNFSIFNLEQAFAGLEGPLPEEGDILVISPFNGLCIPFPCGERFGTIFDVDRTTGFVSKVLEFSGITIGDLGERARFEIGLKLDSEGRTYVLDQTFPEFFDVGGPDLSTRGAILQADLGLHPESQDLGDVGLMSDFNNPLLGPRPSGPWAIDIASSGQIYVVGFEEFSSQLIRIDPTDCDHSFLDLPERCHRTVVSDFRDSSQGPVWAPEFPDVEDNNFEDLAFEAQALVGALGHNTAYVLERFQPSGSQIKARVWAVDVTTGNREIINTFDDANGPQVFGSPKSIEVMNSGKLLVSLETKIYQINPSTKTRTLFSDLTDGTQGVTGFMNRGMEVDRLTGDIFAIGSGLIQINPTTGFRTLVSDLSFTIFGDTFTIGPQDLVIVGQGLGPDNDGDGVIDSQDPNDNDPCIPNPSSPACDSDGDGVFADKDPDENDPCNPNLRSPACDSDSDHYFGYVVTDKTDPKFSGFQIKLSDQFETEIYDVVKPIKMYNPAKKNGEPINDKVTHLKAYKIRGPHTPIGNVVLTNQFDQFVADTKRVHSILVPTAKSHDGPTSPLTDEPVDHFRCYVLEDIEFFGGIVSKKKVVIVDKNFGEKRKVKVVGNPLWCHPVAKIDPNSMQELSTIKNPDLHLTCYKVKLKSSDLGHTRIKFDTNNQFGPEILKTRLHDEELSSGKILHHKLCVPTLKFTPIP